MLTAVCRACMTKGVAIRDILRMGKGLRIPQPLLMGNGVPDWLGL